MRSALKALACLGLATTLLAAPCVSGRVHAGDALKATSRPEATSVRRPGLDSTFDALAQEEDESLAQRRASGESWSTGEIVVVVLLLIFLFPIGLIVLIVLLIVKA